MFKHETTRIFLNIHAFSQQHPALHSCSQTLDSPSMNTDFTYSTSVQVSRSFPKQTIFLCLEGSTQQHSGLQPEL